MDEEEWYFDILVQGIIDGESPAVIAARIGLDVATVRRSYEATIRDSFDLFLPDMETRARVIRERYAAGGVTMADLAREYGISDSNLRKIIRGTIWKPHDPQAGDAAGDKGGAT